MLLTSSEITFLPPSPMQRKYLKAVFFVDSVIWAHLLVEWCLLWLLKKVRFTHSVGLTSLHIQGSVISAELASVTS